MSEIKKIIAQTGSIVLSLMMNFIATEAVHKAKQYNSKRSKQDTCIAT